MTRRRLTVTYVLVAVLGGGVVSAGNRGAARLRGQEYDIVLAGGHVLDPETGLDATRHVGIQGGRIAAVTTELPAARETLDVSGLMVAPGFIDLHAHGQDSESYRYYAHDGVTRQEIMHLLRVAARRGVVCFVHLREGGRDPESGGSVGALQEVLADATATGAALYVVHVTSMGQSDTPFLLQLIAGAREHGLDVTTEAYPYTAASTGIQSAVFDRGWPDRMGIGYRDILYPPTGERLTRTSFQRLRRTGGVVVFFIIPDSIVRLALADPLVMVASDGISAHGHPRLAGTHARVLGRYARDSGALSLMDAVRKMTLMPAQRLEQTVPAMHAKGRVQAGADADLTVFDRVKVLDRATYERPAQFSDGIVHVLVNGTFVVRNGASVAQVYPGRAVRRTP